MIDESEVRQPDSSNSVTNVNGGVNANSERIDIGGDMVGQNKRETHGDDIAGHKFEAAAITLNYHYHYPTNSAEPVRSTPLPKTPPMKRLPTADRKDERDLFARMAAGQTTERVLLIEANAGLGKSDLLGCFEKDCPSGTWPIQIDLKTATGVRYIFRQTLDELGRERFPRFLAADEPTRGGVNIADNKVRGQLQIQIDLGGDEYTREKRLGDLHDAFFEDLRALKQPLLFMFDTYEAATAGSELDNWIRGDFLASAMRTPRLVVVIAGQRVPKPTLKWQKYHKHRRLKPILNPDVWYVCARSAQISFEWKDIQMLCWVTRGHYSHMMDLLVRRAQEQGL